MSYSAAILLFGIGFFYTGWLVFAVLVLFLGLRHPPPLNDLTPLDTKRYTVGGLVAAILVAGFVVVPLAEPWAVGLAGQPVDYPHSLPPGAAVAANFSALVENQNPLAHAYDLSVSVSAVEVNGSGGAHGEPDRGGAGELEPERLLDVRVPGGCHRRPVHRRSRQSGGPGSAYCQRLLQPARSWWNSPTPSPRS